LRQPTKQRYNLGTTLNPVLPVDTSGTFPDTSALSSDYPIHPDSCDSVIWSDGTKLDPIYYSWASGTGAENITINKNGLYKISYSVNFNQIKPASNRTNMKVFLNNTTTAQNISMPCSESFSYGRGNSAGDTTSKITNTSTGLFQLTAGNIIKLNVVFLPGQDGVNIQLDMLANQTWILIEKVGEI